MQRSAAKQGQSEDSRARRWARASRWLIPGLLLLLLLAGKVLDPEPVARIERAGFDLLQNLAPRAPDEAPLRVVDIDDESLARYGQWPWPRSLLARLLDRLRDEGAALVVLDVMLAEPDRTSPAQLWVNGEFAARMRAAGIAPEELPDNDLALAESMGRIPTILGFTFTDTSEAGDPPRRVAGYGFSGPDPRPHLPAYSGAIRDLPPFEQAAAGYGSLNALTDPDGVERRIPLFSTGFGEVYPSLLAESLRVLSGDPGYRLKTAGGSGEDSFGSDTGMVSLRLGAGADAFTIPTDRAGAVVLHLGRDAVSVLPAWRLLDGSAAKDAVDGRIVLVGVSAKGIADLRPTALGPRPSFALQAGALGQILAGEFLERPDWARGAELSLLLLLGLALILVAPRLSPLGSAGFAGILLAVLLVASWVAFTRYRMELDAAYPALALAVLFVVVNLQSFFIADRERAFIHGAFSRYLSPDLVDELARNPQQLRLGGERRELTFLFTDIAGFTTLSEELGPVALAPILNRYFDGACSIILAHGGMVNEFVGDAILAFFGAPLNQRDHAKRAVACVREFDRFAVEFSAEQAKQGIAFGLTRVGLHTGTALIGNFGSQQRFKYAALGDVVNTASRIEGLNKYFGTRVALSGETAAASGATGLRLLGRVVVKGRTQSLEVLELPPPERAVPSRLARYEEAYAAMAAGDASRALPLFRQMHEDDPADGAAAFHLGRLERGEVGDLIVMADK